MPTDVNLLKDRNMKNRKTRLWVLIVLLNMGMGISTFAQKIPLVYTVENTGIKNPAPVLPGIKNTDRSLSMVRWQWPFNQLQGLEPTACRDSPRNRTLRNRRETRSIEKRHYSEYRG